jgi:Spy/CpxP family protein refolding chaperone
VKLISLSLTCLLLILSAGHIHAGTADKFKSEYAGQEKRQIKTLSKDDIYDLQNGNGWGLAKAAELNGVPGPKHLLEMQGEIRLTAEQIRQIEEIFAVMKNQAIPLGNNLIEAEMALNLAFKKRAIDDARLLKLLEDIASVRKQLRYVHLAAHLQTIPVLKEEQISLYNELRGYDKDDPCANIPPGHDPVMWRRHNNCDK